MPKFLNSNGKKYGNIYHLGGSSLKKPIKTKKIRKIDKENISDYSNEPLWKILFFFLNYIEYKIPLASPFFDTIQIGISNADLFAESIAPKIQYLIMYISNAVGAVPAFGTVAEPIAAVAETASILIPILLNYIIAFTAISFNLSRKEWVLFYNSCWDLVPENAEVRVVIMSNCRFSKKRLSEINTIMEKFIEPMHIIKKK